uniref:Phosphorylase b kinase regulatory subunit n=1 Tax=Ascaris lumbricoides TaxID=6252 RepID=A0A0M3HSQ1_ASCLU
MNVAVSDIRYYAVRKDWFGPRSAAFFPKASGGVYSTTLTCRDAYWIVALCSLLLHPSPLRSHQLREEIAQDIVMGTLCSYSHLDK